MKWVVLVALAACGDNAMPPPAPHDLVALPAHVNRELDLIFMLGNEVSTAEHQANLDVALPALFAPIVLDGPGDFHLATITPDLGSSSKHGIGPTIPGSVGGCSGNGDNGAFFLDRFTTDPADLGTLMYVGSSGCGFQQPLAAMAAAFANPANAGFRRPEAALGVIVLADEDDCSALDPSLFDINATDLGALQSFRCAQFGLTCAEPDMTSPGPRTNCVPKSDSTVIEDPADFVGVLRSQSSDPRRLAFAAILAPSDVEIEPRAPQGSSTTIPAVGAACKWLEGNGTNVADEAVRLTWFANQFGGTIGSICNHDLTPAATTIGTRLRRALGDPCVEDDVPLTSCTAVDELGTTETPIEPCMPALNTCWELVTDPDVCPNAAHQKLVVHRFTDAPDGTYTLLRCG